MKLTAGRLLLLLLPLLLLCCDCFAKVHLESGPGDPNGISKTSFPNEAMRSTPKVPFGRSVDDPSTNSVAADFPCPDAEAIAPCVCTVESDNRIDLDCTLVESEEQLATVFQQEFPVKDLYQFHMDENSAVTSFPSFMNGVTFESLNLNPGPFVLERISNYFFLDLKDTLTYIYIRNSKLQTDFFPFALLPQMKLQTLHIHGSEMNWIPEIRAPNLTYFAVDYSPVETLDSGTIQVGTEPMVIDLQSNQIRTIEPGSIFFADQNNQSIVCKVCDINPNVVVPWNNKEYPTITNALNLGGNQLATVDEAVFRDLMPFINVLYLYSNPLTCGCDIAWLVLNEAYMNLVDLSAACADGTNLHDLDPQDYLDFCRR